MELYSFYWFSRYSGNRLYRTLVIRMTLPLKQETILRDLESRAEQVYSTLRGRMHSSCGDQLAGSENLNRLPPLWDLPVFNQETLASFFHLEGCKKWDWREMSLRDRLGMGPGCSERRQVPPPDVCQETPGNSSTSILPSVS